MVACVTGRPFVRARDQHILILRGDRTRGPEWENPFRPIIVSLRYITRKRETAMYSIIRQHIPDVRNELFERKLIARSDMTVFQVGSCVLVEDNPFFNQYIYRAIDMPTGKHRQIYSRTSKLHKSRYDFAADRMMALPFYQPLDVPDTQERGTILIERMFKTILPQHGFTYREAQLKLSVSIFSAMQRRHIALSEAGVGSGKTIAYIIAAVVFRLLGDEHMPVIISTSTIALQKAITEEYLPQISNILESHCVIDKPLRFVVRKGKAHYACDLRLQGYHASIQELDNDDELLAVLEQIKAADYRQLDLSFYPVSRYVKDCICLLGRCPSNCPKRKGCRYLSFVEHCMQDDFAFIVANHQLVFAHIANRNTGGNDILPPHQAIIFDEAHKLLEAARQIYGNRLAESDTIGILTDIPLSRIPSIRERKVLHGWIELVNARNKRIFSQLDGGKGSEDGSRAVADMSHGIRASMKTLGDDLAHTMTLCRQCGDRQLRALIPTLQERCDEVNSRLSFFIENPELILWLEKEAKGTNLCGIPKDMDVQLYRDIWSHSEPFVLTSGTMSVKGDFRFLKAGMGLSQVAEHRIAASSAPSPFDYAKNTLLYTPTGMPFPTLSDMGYTRAIADEVMRLIEATRGHTVILFTSYYCMEYVYELTKEAISGSYPFFILQRGRVDILANFKRSRNGVLFASDAAGEGVDFSGDILSSLIIVKLPFAVPDPITEYEKEQYPSLNAYQKAVTIPRMLIKLRQYFGRAIRNETDAAVISILDSRVAQGGKFRDAVLDALPPTRVTNRIEDVEAFIRAKKDDAYFSEGNNRGKEYTRDV